MGIFGPDAPKRVNREEWKEIWTSLYGTLDEQERNDLEMLFRADMDEPGIEEGISQPEFTAGITWLSANLDKHHLEASDIEALEKRFAEHLKD